MKKVELNRKNVLKAYKEADSDGKKLLENLIGKEVFTQNTADRIKTYEDALEETDRPDVTNFGDVPEDLIPAFKSFYRVLIETEALNQEKMDIYDSSTNRYYPYYRCNGSPSGFAFRCSNYDFTDARAGSGSRLSFKNSDLSDYFGRQFKQDMQDFLTK